MKKIPFSIIILLLGQMLYAQTLFTYGKKGSYAVDREEFLAAFNKNNPEDRSLQAKREYLEQFYIPFKLKVQAARDRRLDTLPSLKYELENYKRQVLNDNLVADSAVQALCAEAYTRSLHDIRLSHIFVPFSDAYVAPNSYIDPEPEDTVTAYKKTMEAYKALLGGAEFSETALGFSGDPSVKTNRGDIGFITVFSLPYHLENIAYSLEKGQFSAPYKSKGGYHILIKTDERPAFGSIAGAQILLAFPPGITPGEKQVLRARADSLYKALLSGAAFDALARQYSSDYNAATTGGALNPAFRIGRYDPGFEAAVTALSHDGAFTKPVETAYGIHIVKRKSHVPVTNDSLRAMVELKPQVLNDSRIAVSNEQEEKRILAAVGYKNLFDNDSMLWEITEGIAGKEGYTFPPNITPATAVFAVGKETRTVADWLGYVNSIRSNYRSGSPMPYATLMKYYTTVTVKNYYRDNLELYSPSFRKQLKEFEEGNLFFEIMGREIWNRSADDEKKLVRFYRQNRPKYTWGESIDAVLFTAIDKSSAEEIQSDPERFVRNWRILAQDANGNIMADSARFETAFVPGYNSSMPEKSLSVLSGQNEEGPYSLLYIISRIPGGAIKSFKEARGFVISDYQSQLDAKWQQQLRKKYPVNINTGVLNTL